MTTSFLFTVYHSPFTVRYPFTQHLARASKILKLSAGFTVIRDQWLIVNGKSMACPALNPERSSLQSDYGASRFSAGVNSQWLMVNGASWRSI